MQKHLEVKIRASYHKLNELTEQIERIWIVFHGQGMLAQYFIRKFEVLDPKKNYILAPQGLSKYYLEGFTGRVGASWMTKEDRLTEIDNQMSYLNGVIAAEGVEDSNAEIILFGFSQGVATACRFGAFSQMDFKKLVLWAGTFPPDIPVELTQAWGQKVDMVYFTGNQDPFFKEGMIEHQYHQVLQSTGAKPRLIRFDGKHEVIPSLLGQI
jgi:predicted esterase